MTHPSVEDVALHLEGALGPADELRVRTHLEQCADCAATAQDLRGVTAQLQAAVSPDSSVSIPAAVAARVDSAIAQEAAERADGARDGAEKVPVEAMAATRVVGDLAERRRRRRRVLSGGLLAAAAATVVAVGIGQLTQTSGSGEAAAGNARSVAAQDESRQPGQRTEALGPEAVRREPKVPPLAGAAQDDGSTRPRGQAFRNRDLAAMASLARQRDLALIEGAAAAHSPAQARHDLPGCVRSALGDDLGPVASYEVTLPGNAGAPGVVVLRPTRAPTVGVLVACASPPHVLARSGLRP